MRPSPDRILGAVVLEVARRELDRHLVRVEKIEARLAEVGDDPRRAAAGALVAAKARRELMAWTEVAEEAIRRHVLVTDAAEWETAQAEVMW